MIDRSQIRYGTIWVRLLCCAGVGAIIVNCSFFRLLEVLEQGFTEFLLEPGITYVRISRPVEYGIILITCLASAVLRIDRPIAMIAMGTISAFTYVLTMVLVYLFSGITLPSTSPLLAIFGCVAFLETMAWSEERTRRRSLESLEKVKQQFTDMLVHDLRRRMSSIMISLSLLEKNAGSRDPATDEALNTIRVSADRLMLQINAILDIRKIEEGKMRLQLEPVELSGIIKEVLAEHATAARLSGMTFMLNVEHDSTVELDISIFSRVLSNLLWNAIQYAPASSTTEIICSLTAAGRPSVSIANPGRVIPREQQHRLFSPFESGDSRPSGAGAGTGLGLTFCKLALEAHGGTIHIESPCSKYGSGVRVQIELQPASVR